MKILNIAIGMFLFGIVGCTKKDTFEDRPLRDIYKSAFLKLQKGEFGEAGEEFLEVDRQYPYSTWASKSILMSSFCFYKGKKFDDAVRNLEIFTKFNMNHANVDYAYYLMSLCNLMQVSASTKDMEKASDALESLRILIRKFQNSKYITDSRKKIIYINNLLAAHEMNIGRFYARNKNFIAALDRYKNVIQFYFNTPHLPEAYYRMVEGLIALGLTDEARSVFAKMPHIDKLWYEKSEKLLSRFRVIKK